MDEPIENGYWVEKIKENCPTLKDIFIYSIQQGRDDGYTYRTQPKLDEGESLKKLDKTIKCNRCKDGEIDLSGLNAVFPQMLLDCKDEYPEKLAHGKDECSECYISHPNSERRIECSNPKCKNELRYRLKLIYKEPKKKYAPFKRLSLD